MATMVDAYGPSACCDECDAATEEEDLIDLDGGVMVCRGCHEDLRKLAETLCRQ